MMLMLAIPIFLIFQLISPPDWVDVTVGPFPKDSKQYYLIAEDSKGAGFLSWYHSKVIAFPEDPSWGGGYSDFDPDGFTTASVKWREARRYGVLIHRRDNQWRIWWINPQEMGLPSITRVIFGGGKAEMHLADEEHAQMPSRELMKRLGFD